MTLKPVIPFGVGLREELHRVGVHVGISVNMDIVDKVRPLRSKGELEKRLTPPNYGFALIHPKDPLSPVAFTFCRLQVGPVRSSFLREVERNEPSTAPDTAVFYSVNSTFTGLGVAGGLLKWAMDKVERQAGRPLTIVTFSPIPDYSVLAGDGSVVSEERLSEFLSSGSDCVARFHIRNGAKLDKVIKNADLMSEMGQSSCGWQASYRYK
jgi:malonyl-CoA decarboxylase